MRGLEWETKPAESAIIGLPVSYRTYRRDTFILFNIFIAAVLVVVLQTFSEEAVILAELVYLQEHLRETIPESPVDCVRRTVWGILYADNTCIASCSPRAIEKKWRLSSTYATHSG